MVFAGLNVKHLKCVVNTQKNMEVVFIIKHYVYLCKILWNTL